MKRIQFLTFSFLLTLPFSSLADSASELITKAQQAFQQQKYSTALIHLKNAAKDNPRDLSVRLELLKLFVFTGQGTQAQTELDKAKRLNAKPTDITVLEAKANLLVGEFDKVTDGFNFVDLPQKDIARIRALQGQAFFEKRNFKQARLRFQRAYLLDSTPMEVQIGQARLFKIDGNTTEEKKLVVSLLTKYPLQPEVMLLAGEFFYTQKQYDQALKLFRAAGEIQASNVNVWFGVVRSLIGKGEFEEAKKEIGTVLTNYPEHQVGNYLLAVIAFEQNDFARAKSAIEIVLKGQKRKFEALKLLGTINFQQGDLTEAERNLKKFLKFNPNDTQGMKTLAAVYLKRRQGTLAVHYLKPLEHLNDAYVLSMLANAYQLMGNKQRSEQYMLKAMKLDPHNTIIERQYQRTKLQSGETINLAFNDPEFTDFSGQGHLEILNLFRQKNYSKANEVINGYLAKNPDSGFLHYLLGSSALYENKIDIAKKYFIKANQLSPQLVEAKLNLAKIHMVEGKGREAERLYREVLKMDKNNDAALVALAGIFHRRGENDEMLKWLNKSRSANSASLASREVLLDIYKREGNVTKALKISKEMSEIQPENIQLLVQYAELLKQSGRPDLGVKVYQQIIELQPNSAAAWYGLGKMESFDKDYERAYKSFEKTLQLAPDSVIVPAVLVNLDLRNNNLKAAETRAKNMVKKHPKISESYEVLGDVFMAKKQPSKAINQYQKSVNIKYNTEVYVKLFRAYNRNNQVSTAFKKLKQWVAKQPKDLALKEVLALTHQSRDEYKQAESLYLDIIKNNRKNDRIFNNLALVELALNSPMSIEYADIAYNMNNKSAKNLDTLAWVHFKRGNLNEALELSKKAVQASPDNPDIRYHYAEALVKADRIREAKNQLAVIVSIDGFFKNRDKAKALFDKIKSID